MLAGEQDNEIRPAAFIKVCTSKGGEMTDQEREIAILAAQTATKVMQHERYSVNQLADILKVSKRTIANWVKTNRLPMPSPLNDWTHAQLVKARVF